LKYTVLLEQVPVLLNDILRTPARHQSRLKANGKKGKLGYKQLAPYFDSIPKFDKPVILHILIYQTKKHPIDIDSVNKTLLDGMKKMGIIVDDNHNGIKSMTCKYAKGFYEQKRIKLSIIE